MNGNVHAAYGLVSMAGLILEYQTSFEVCGVKIIPVIAICSVAAGSYAPDVDLARSHAGNKHKITSKVVSTVGGGHRGWVTHSLLVPAILAATIFVLSTTLAQYGAILQVALSLLFGFGFGWVAHVWLDLFNGKGCPILWPLSTSKISIMDLPSTGKIPWAFIVLHTILIGVLWGLKHGLI